MERYSTIRDEMLRRVNSGEWPVGMDLPHEADLAAQFGVARGTIRRSLAGLVEQGMIQRRRRAGSRVVAREAHASRLSIPIVRSEVEGRGKAYAHRLLSVEKLQGRPDFGAVSGILAVRCLHLANGAPFQFEDREINLDALPEAAEQDFTQASPNEWLVRVVPATEVITRLCADGAGRDAARHLSLKQGAPVFILERQTFLDGVALTRVSMIHPADAYDITTRSG